MTNLPPSLCEFRRLHAVGGCVASARLSIYKHYTFIVVNLVRKNITKR